MLRFDKAHAAGKSSVPNEEADGEEEGPERHLYAFEAKKAVQGGRLPNEVYDLFRLGATRAGEDLKGDDPGARRYRRPTFGHFVSRLQSHRGW